MVSKDKGVTKTGGRAATSGVIAGDFALCVGCPRENHESGWPWVPLTDVARLESGHTPSRRHPEYWDGEIPWIGIRDATGNHGRTIFETLQKTNDLGIANSSARVLPAGTVCLSRTASVGYVVVMGVPMATSQDFVNWVCGPSIDPMYLKYVLLAERNSFLRFASGTTHQTIYFPEVKAFHIALPPINAQQRIVEVLKPFDDRLDSLRNSSSKLLALSTDLFKSWFIDFEPVKARSLGMGTAHASEEVMSIFSDGFVDTQMGPIPRDWRLGTIEELLVLQRGFDLPATDRSDGRFPVLAASGPNGFHAEAMVKGPGVTTGRSGVLGNVYYVQGDFWPLNTSLWVKEFRKASPAYAFHLLQSLDLRRMNAGSAVPTLNRNHVHGLAAVVPSDASIAAFTRVAAPILERIETNERLASQLLTFRDSVLTRLVSGKTTLKDAIQVTGLAVA
jgi:type I restriction enzyme S subunit